MKVQLRNDAHVAADRVEAARHLVDRIYSRAGVAIAWSDEDPRVTVILKREPSPVMRRAEDAMGLTPGGGALRGRLAFVFINRVTAVATGYGTAYVVVLGVAIAHELGHLLLTKDHTTAGLMKPYFNQADFRAAKEGRLLFSDEQTRLIRATIAKPGDVHTFALPR